MIAKTDIKNFRCKHRHSALSHPKCYIKFLRGEEDKKTLPKILVMDIETSPLTAYVWQKSVWKASITDDHIISEWYMLCWSAKWLFDNNIMADRLTSKEALAEDDSRIVGSLWKLLDEADIVIAHNGDTFDVPNMNTRFIVNNYTPPSPYKTIDTVKIARRQFGFTHNSLRALAKVFGFKTKLETNFELWKKCTDGDEESLKSMEEYNKNDVRLLEDVYTKLRPWINGHPNLGMYMDFDGPVCPNCGSDNIKWIDGKFWYASSSKYPLFTCDNCGAFGKSRTNVVTKEEKKNLASPIPR